MSREVRRVPVGWEHPTEYNPYRYVHDHKGLMGSYPDAFDEWTSEGFQLRGRTGHEWSFYSKWCLTGYDDCSCHHSTGIVHPYVLGEVPHEVRDEDHLFELLQAYWYYSRPNPEDYMPVWSEEEATGWCLYETVSEGTPVTPVFASADELINHLSTVGQAHSGPMRRSAAEALVGTGYSFGSMLITAEGQILNSAEDADKVEEWMKSDA